MDIAVLIISILELLVISITALVAILEFKRHNKNTKTEYISKLYLKLIEDKELLSVFEKFDCKGVNNNDIDVKKIDRFLTFLENILFLNDQHYLNDFDLGKFNYFIEKTVLNVGIKKYFEELGKTCEQNGLTFPYPLLRKYQLNHKDKIFE